VRTSPLTKVLICLLALGTFVLAAEAKRCQYQPDGATGYLSQSVKMSGNRHQADIAPPVTAPFAILRDLTRAWVPRLPERVVLPAAPHLTSFRYRPPPFIL
jgi:hypothetical protein